MASVDDLLTIHEAARLCGLNQRAIIRAIVRGELTRERTSSGHLRVDRLDVADWLERRSAKTTLCCENITDTIDREFDG